MAEAESPANKEVPKPQGNGNPAENALAIPSPIKEALETIPDQQTRAILSVALSRTSLGVGPDPETAKIIADSEMHQENCRLEGYRAALQNRDKQADRDHQFRGKKLNHQSLMTGAILAVSVAGSGIGLYLSISGNPSLGNPVMVAALGLLASLAGKLLSAKDN